MSKKQFKDYKKCLDFLFSLERVGIKYDLKNITTLLNFLNNPQKNFKSIHIAGTNGKGSVASIINSVLIENGFKTGLYTSPHILDFKERILINGNDIPKQFVIDFSNKVYNLVLRIIPSFFEVTTAMAFEYFSEQKVEYAVIEAGLGGRLDSTNVLKPLISIITGISIDHTEYLGTTIEKISFEKAGIIKNKIPVVIGDIKDTAFNVIKKKCIEKGSILIESNRLKNVNILKRLETGINLDIFGKKYFYPIVGDYQISNIKTAFTVLQKIYEIDKIILTENIFRSGLNNILINSKFYGRFQLIGEHPSVVIDVSHNLQGISQIIANLKYFEFKNLFVIFGMMKDKNYGACVRLLEKLDAKIILTKPDYKRAEEAEILFKSSKYKEKFYISENVKAAFVNAKKLAERNDLILITGSFYLVSESLRTFKFKNII